MIEFDRDMLVLRVGFLIQKKVVRSMEQTKTLRVPHSCDPFGQVDFPIFKKGFQGRGLPWFGQYQDQFVPRDTTPGSNQVKGKQLQL